MIWNYGIVTLAVYDSAGFLGLQIDSYATDTEGLQPAQNESPLGILSCPLDPELGPDGQPDPTKACTAQYCWEGGRQHARGSYDPRIIPKLPRLAKGATLLYGGTAANVRYVHVDDAGVTLGQLLGAVPIALATPLITYLTALEAAVKLASAGPPGAAATSAAVDAAAAMHSSIPATLAKAF